MPLFSISKTVRPYSPEMVVLEKKKFKKPLKFTVILGCVIFITILCVSVGIVSYFEYKNMLYDRYEAYITDVLNYVRSNTDVDDLSECLSTGQKSEKFEKLQSLIDNVKETHKIEYLYIIIPLNTDKTDNVMNVMAAMTRYERENDPSAYVELGGLTGDSYPSETAAKYCKAKDSKAIVFFVDETPEFGFDFTGILNLKTSDGKFFAQLCVDVPERAIRTSVQDNLVATILVIVGICIVFTVAFIFWGSKRVVDPIRKLEKSVVGFVDQKTCGELRYEAPDIHTGNEIESLSNAVTHMTEDLDGYINKVVDAERESERLRVIASDMTELANKDSLTGVKNKNALALHVQELQLKVDDEENFAFAICVFDCDNLKTINDRYGHEKGDRYLVDSSNFIRNIFKNSEIYRAGGDEFIAILTDSDFENKNELVDQFYRELGEIKLTKENEWEQIRITMGIATFNRKLDHLVSDTFRRADKSMYSNKRIGKIANGSYQSTYFMESDDAYWKEQYIIDSFKNAIDKKLIKVYYQPIMRINSGKLVLLEALARWIDPVRGLISPGEFVGILSRHHTLHLLDLYMVESVCEEFTLRAAEGLPLVPVSVNVSAQDFDFVDIPQKLKEITDRHGIKPKNIIVEITEQDIAEGTDHFKDALEKLRQLGFKVWIDDFGSGYSSLNVLSRYKVDRIKFDMDLITHLDDNNGANRKILSAMIEVCGDLGIKTLAEGVENEEQFDFLKEVGCDLAQGFYFYKPEPTDVSIYKFKHRSADIPHELDEV